MTLNGMLISGTGGRMTSDGEQTVTDGGEGDERVSKDADDNTIGVKVASDVNTSTPRLGSAGNF